MLQTQAPALSCVRIEQYPEPGLVYERHPRPNSSPYRIDRVTVPDWLLLRKVATSDLTTLDGPAVCPRIAIPVFLTRSAT